MTVDRKTGALAAVIVVLLTVVGFLLGQRTGVSDGDRMDHSTMHGGTAGTNSTLLGSDVMFLQMMIPHHQQAVDISDLAIARSKDAELVALAQDIRDGQAEEITQMQEWLAAAGQSETMDHSMDHGMGGMLSDDELATLQSLSGREFDIYWLQRMIAHHEGALHMVTMIRDSSETDVRSFGESVDSTQSAQIAQMKAMLERLGS